MVDLKDFVRDSIVGIVDGVAEAQQKIASKAMINPGHRSLPAGALYFPGKTGLVPLQEIGFDLAVTAASEDSGGAKVGFLVGVFGGGAAMGGKDSQQTVSRLRFAVPVALPETLGNSE
jgi:hypothetical protein